MSDVKELLECAETRLKAHGDMLIRTMKEQIERDQRRIEQDGNEIAGLKLLLKRRELQYEELADKWAELLGKVEDADSRALAAAEAMKEAAAKVADENFHRGGYFIRALSVDDVLKGLKP